MTKALATMLIVAALSCGCATSHSESTLWSAARVKGDENVTTFAFNLKKGDFVFIGLDSKIKDEHESEHGIKPKSQFHIDKSSNAEIWKVDFILDNRMKNSLLFKVDVLAKTKQETSERELSKYRLSWQDNITNDNSVPNVIMKELDFNIEGLKYYKFPYYKDNNGSASIIIAVSDKYQNFEKVIKIPETYILFDWKKFVTLK